MSLHRRNPRRDANEREIIDALEAAGCTVQQLSIKGCPDLLVGYVDTWSYNHNEYINLLMEVKTAKGKLTDDEQTWIDAWNGQVTIVRSVEEALKAIRRRNDCHTRSTY